MEDIDSSYRPTDIDSVQPPENLFIISATILFIVSTSVAILVFSILSSKKARSTPFNQYLIYLSFPDWAYSFCCLITCIMNASVDAMWSETMCLGQAVYMIFGTSANCWLNAVITYEVHRLLKASKNFKRYVPPSQKNVIVKSFVSYAIALFLGLLCLVRWKQFPFHVEAHYGYVCLPVQETWQDYVFFYIFFIPMYVGIPMGYVFWVFCDVVFRSKLLPKEGKRRDIALYFFRISFVFVIFWVPTIVLVYMIPDVVSPWAHFGIAIFSHCQGIASAGVSFMKSDVKEAFENFYKCKFREANAEWIERQRQIKAGIRLPGHNRRRKARVGSALFKMAQNEPEYPYDIPGQYTDYIFEGEADDETYVGSITGTSLARMFISRGIVPGGRRTSNARSSMVKVLRRFSSSSNDQQISGLNSDISTDINNAGLGHIVGHSDEGRFSSFYSSVLSGLVEVDGSDDEDEECKDVTPNETWVENNRGDVREVKTNEDISGGTESESRDINGGAELAILNEDEKEEEREEEKTPEG